MDYRIILLLVFSNLLYASESIFSKYASMGQPLGLQFFVGIFAVVVILGLYAVLWQKILKRVDLSIAYMFKGTSLVFVLLFSVVLFGESITLNNIIGTILLLVGICLYANN